MTKTTFRLSAAMAVLLLGSYFAPLSSGQKMGEKDRLVFENFRVTRLDLIKGKEQLKKKQLDNAEQTLLKVLKKMPENALASYFLAETYYQKGEFEKGLAAIDEAEKNFPWIQKLIYSDNAGMNNKAKASGQGPVVKSEWMNFFYKPDLNPADIDTEIQAEQQQTGEPITRTTETMRIEAASRRGGEQVQTPAVPTVPTEGSIVPAEWSYIHGNLLFRQKKYEEALAQYYKTIASDPQQGQALNNIANIYFMARQYDKALEYIEKAEASGAKVNPNFKKAVLTALGK